MAHQWSVSDPKALQNHQIRFAGDSDLTFVNYGSEVKNGLSYRRDARIHNAGRRKTRRKQDLSRQNNSVQQEQRLQSMVASQKTSLLDPLSTFERDPFSRDITASPQALEHAWRSNFTKYFHLPQLKGSNLGIPDPSEYFLNAARTSLDLYRSLVIQAVMTSNVNAGIEPQGDVVRNQALIIRDVRRLTELYNTPSVQLTSQQFQQIYASAFSLLGHGFNKEAGYNAIVIANGFLMAVPHNQAVAQTPVTEWIRMLMPRPGLYFHRSEPFRVEMFRKINLVFDFIEIAQGDLTVPFSAEVSRYLQPNTALYTTITSPLPDPVFDEPYDGFLSVCLHRTLSMLYRIFDQISRVQTPQTSHILAKLEFLASVCIAFPPSQRIALFVWCLIANARSICLKDNREEPLFPWAMKDLLIAHDFSFVSEMVAWILYRADPHTQIEPPFLDVSELRQKMPEFYNIGQNE